MTEQCFLWIGFSERAGGPQRHGYGWHLSSVGHRLLALPMLLVLSTQNYCRVIYLRCVI